MSHFCMLVKKVSKPCLFLCYLLVVDNIYITVSVIVCAGFACNCRASYDYV